MNSSNRQNLEKCLRAIPHNTGIYRMLASDGTILYVGKAKDLKKRVASYLRQHNSYSKLRKLMEKVNNIEVTITRTETEALLLENNIIKEHKPRYNIMLRDDKSYPYIRVTTDDVFPRISFYRGSRKHAGRYFGPYANVHTVRETLNLLHKLFQIRQCDNSFFKNRTRPCLQYQIKRCSAPCVGLINEMDYAQSLLLVIEFLSGNSQKVIETLLTYMDKAAYEKKYEDAAKYRDQIALLREISEQQYINLEKGNLDIIACALYGNFACIQVFAVRNGLNIGNKVYYPDLAREDTINEGKLLKAFIGQYYLVHTPPHEILLSHQADEEGLLISMLEHKYGHKLRFLTTVRGDRNKCLKNALANASSALESMLISQSSMEKQLVSLQTTLDLPTLPIRIECFDASHTMGSETVVSCVVFGITGAIKKEYKLFNIKGITCGDDYAALHQAIERHYRRLIAEEGKLPDILFVDGGKGQLKVAQRILRQLNLETVTIVGIAKGEKRKAGKETLYLSTENEIITLMPDDATLLMVLKIRDEAHRFAITAHRRQRAKRHLSSPLESVHGLGAKRRQDLIKYFGGFRGVSRASTEELSKVPGIGKVLAHSIHGQFHIT